MGIITDDMRRVIADEQLGFFATVTPDGLPNLSPKGAMAVWDDDHLVFADIRSPGTLRNLAANPAIEVNVVDHTLRKGWRFKGVAEILSDGPRYDQLVAFFRARGSTSAYRHMVLIRVERAAPLVSPAYDTGRSETDVAAQWEATWAALSERRRRDG
jgi:predicted pyridoxine 5'-phosphate oxidase superfamily flavin-nucleotide-binding protein